MIGAQGMLYAFDFLVNPAGFKGFHSCPLKPLTTDRAVKLIHISLLKRLEFYKAIFIDLATDTGKAGLRSIQTTQTNFYERSLHKTQTWDTEPWLLSALRAFLCILSAS